MTSTTSLELPTTQLEFFSLLESTFVREKPSDDMLFYVREHSAQRSADERLLVRRWNAQRKDVPTLDSPGGIDWEASYYLNVIVHLSYELEFKVFRKEPAAANSTAATADLSDQSAEFVYTELRGKKTPIYASPSRVSLDKGDKAAESQMTFPDIYFTLHDHDMHDRNNAPLSRDNEYVSIRLTAAGAFLGVDLPNVELFRGVASQAVVFQAYQKIHSAAAAAPARRLPFARSRAAAPTGHYLALRGPRGKGRAQMSVATTLDGDGDDDCAAAASAPPSPAPDKPGLVQSLFSGWRRQASEPAPATTTTTTTTAAPAAVVPLYCSLTFVSIPYDAIVGDCTKAWASKSLIAKEQ